MEPPPLIFLPYSSSSLRPGAIRAMLRILGIREQLDAQVRVL